MLENASIGFFDSGVGGLSVLKYALEYMPEENYIYFGDSLNAPYGTKSREQVFELTEKAVNMLISEGVKAIVVACNTATSIAVDELRKRVDVPIISMEPAIKPALTKTSGKVLLLATSVTVSSERVNALIERYDKSGRVVKVACPELAKRIEDAVFFGEDIDNYIETLLLPYKALKPTAAVLGCTHYPFVAPKIKKVLGDDVALFDGIEGTVQHLKNILIENNIKNSLAKKGSVTIKSSLNDDNALALYYKLLAGGSL